VATRRNIDFEIEPVHAWIEVGTEKSGEEIGYVTGAVALEWSLDKSLAAGVRKARPCKERRGTRTRRGLREISSPGHPHQAQIQLRGALSLRVLCARVGTTDADTMVSLKHGRKSLIGSIAPTLREKCAKSGAPGTLLSVKPDPW
jgi:hypothetical protein